ncbi:Gfo/Idh/MocA family protein [Chloroflexota bacterium]
MKGIKSNKHVLELGIGMLGCAFMGRAHSNAYKKLLYTVYPPSAIPDLIAIAGLEEEEAKTAAQRYGYKDYYTDWRKMVADDRIDLLDNAGSNDVHAEACIAAANLGKHVLCEKPMARNKAEAAEMLEAVNKAGVKNAVDFNYRFVPAIRQAKMLIESGALGRIYHYRARYLQDWLMPHYNTAKLWKMDRERAGSGAVGDLGSHIIDLGRFLVGEPRQVSAFTRTFISERQLEDGSGMGPVNVDDAFAAIIEFENGAIGTLEATRFAAGRKNFNCLEINAEKGSLQFNLERLNELEVFWAHEQPDTTQGFHTTLVTESDHPFMEHWWPPGHMLGWEDTFVNLISHFLNSIANDTDVAPYGATFEDGYKNAVICDAILESANDGRCVDIRY